MNVKPINLTTSTEHAIQRLLQIQPKVLGEPDSANDPCQGIKRKMINILSNDNLPWDMIYNNINASTIDIKLRNF